jgi:hypothetical protein
MPWRFRRDERRVLLRTHSHIQLSNSPARSACSPDRAKRYPGTMAQTCLVVPAFRFAQCALQVVALRQKKIVPCSHALGQGVARIPVFSLPLRRGGRRADEAQCPNCSGRVSGLRRMSGALRCTPRLSARQRGIFGLRLISGRAAPGAVCPWRVSPEPARGSGVRPPRPQVAAPAPRLQDASGRRPSYLDRDMSRLAKISLDVKSRFSY